MLIEALLRMGNGERGTGNGERGIGNGVQPSGLVGLGDGVEFNLNGAMWDSFSPAPIAREMKGRW